MITTIVSNLKDWAQATDARQKLQHTYLSATLVLVLGAGVIGLIDYDLGQKILLGAFICIAIFIANAVVWALVQSFILFKIATPLEDKPEKTTVKQVRSPRKK